MCEKRLRRGPRNIVADGSKIDGWIPSDPSHLFGDVVASALCGSPSITCNCVILVLDVGSQSLLADPHIKDAQVEIIC